MHSWHDDIVKELARALMALPDDHPAIVALPPDAASARAWLLREHAAEMDLEAARGRMPPGVYGRAIKIDRSSFDQFVRTTGEAEIDTGLRFRGSP